jgi:hypothetical protein
MSHVAPDPKEFAALERLIRLTRNDTQQARSAADLLLAWWDATRYGGFDLQHLWTLNANQREDALEVLRYIARAGHGPDLLGLTDEFSLIAKHWRPTE